MSVRRAEKAGSWYASVAGELEEEIAVSLDEADRYLAKIPAAGTGGGEPVAAVVPHAGLVYSGGIAGAAFKLIRKALERVDTFLVFGACHRQRLSRAAVWAEGRWETPLGPIEVDTELAELLIGAGIGEVNETAHHDDNAIELETPFIRAMFPEAAMVPVAMGFFPGSWRIGEQAATAVAASRALADRTIVALASTDLTHYGSAFGVMPAGTGEAALEWTRENDARFIAALTEMRFEEIVPIASRDKSACGAGAAAAVVGWARARGSREGRLLAYATSHDIAPTGAAEHFVGYGSILFEKEG